MALDKPKKGQSKDSYIETGMADPDLRQAWPHADARREAIAAMYDEATAGEAEKHEPLSMEAMQPEAKATVAPKKKKKKKPSKTPSTDGSSA